MTTKITAVIAWLQQTSTILGLATVAGVGAALIAHQMSVGEAIPAAIAAVVAIAMPGNSGAQAAAKQAATDAVAVAQSRGLAGSPMALGADLVTLAGMLHPSQAVVAVATSVAPISPSAAAPMPPIPASTQSVGADTPIAIVNH